MGRLDSPDNGSTCLNRRRGSAPLVRSKGKNHIFKNELHITIGSFSTPDTGASEIESGLLHDSQLIKSALLFADKVELCSPFSSILNRFESFSNVMNSAPFTKKIRSMIEMVQIFGQDQQYIDRMEFLLELASKKHPRPKEIVMIKKMEREFEEDWRKFELVNYNMPGGMHISALLKISKSGCLDFHRFPSGLIKADNGEAFAEFTQLIQKTLSSPSTYPLFDDQTGKFVTSEILKGTYPVSSIAASRSKQSGLASKLFENLPQFELASVDEILDIRKDLQVYLDRFRSAILKYSEGIVSAQWDAGFSFEAEQVFLKDVAPIIKDIEEQTASNKYLKMLTRRYADKPLNFAYPALSVALTRLSNFPDILTALSGLAPIGANILDVFNEWRKNALSISQNQLFFYYALNKKI